VSNLEAFCLCALQINPFSHLAINFPPYALSTIFHTEEWFGRAESYLFTS
jgi:hypothetical protein